MSAAPNWVPVDEYLYNTYHPDCDYVDGVLVERNVGEIPHAKVQRRVLIYFYQRERQSNNFALQECRVQVSPTRYRVPDVCVTIDPSLTETSSPSHLFYALRFCHRRTA